MTTHAQRPDDATTCEPCSGTGRTNLQPNGDSDVCKNCNGRGWTAGMVQELTHGITLHNQVIDHLGEDLERFRLRYQHEQGATIRKIKVDALMQAFGISSHPRLANDIAGNVILIAMSLRLGNDFQDLAFVIERELAMVAFRTERAVLASLDKRAVKPPVLGESEFDKLPIERVTMAEFAALSEYSTTLPTGTTIGKKWKRKHPLGWMMGEYIDIDRVDQVGIKWSRIQVETSP